MQCKREVNTVSVEKECKGRIRKKGEGMGESDGEKNESVVRQRDRIGSEEIRSGTLSMCT